MQESNPAADIANEPGFDLDATEIRVLGVLIEKAFITPDAYPLSTMPARPASTWMPPNCACWAC